MDKLPGVLPRARLALLLTFLLAWTVVAQGSALAQVDQRPGRVGPASDPRVPHRRQTVAVKLRPGQQVAAVLPDARGRAVERWFEVSVRPGEEPLDAVHRLAQRPGVEVAELLYTFSVEPGKGSSAQLLTAQGAPNDPGYQDQWHFPPIHVVEAWERANGSGVTVAVLDTGISRAGEDLTCRTFVDEYDAISDISGQGVAEDQNGHGTHVAGTIAQCTGNGVGVAGIAFQATLMPVQVLDANGVGTTLELARGLHWARQHGADIINMSAGGICTGAWPSCSSEVVNEALAAAAAADIVLVAAAGNQGSNSGVSFPANHPEVIGVGAVDLALERAPYSNGGPGLDLVAPGGDSADLNEDGYVDGVLQETLGRLCGAPTFTAYCFLQGTSFSAAHVSGAAALLRARVPWATPEQVRLALERTAADLGSAGFDGTYGHGLVLLDHALDLLPTLPRSEVGVQDPTSGVWTLRFADESTNAFYYGNPADIPVACDWNGDGVQTVGLYRSTDGFLYLRNSNTQGVADLAIFYGEPEDLPVCGDWNGDGVETIGIFRPSEGRFYLRNSNTQGVADFSFFFGDPGDLPFAGDWDGDGVDTVGLWRPTTGRVYITNVNTTKVADFDAFYGNPGDRFVVGDWDGDGRDSFGIFRPSEGRFYLSDTVGQAVANRTITFG
ncbi:MAG: S8 family serine peptidase, partial [Acidimicrobiia bacterium]